MSELPHAIVYDGSPVCWCGINHNEPMYWPRILLFKRWLIYRQRRDYRAFGVTMQRGWKFRRVG